MIITPVILMIIITVILIIRWLFSSNCFSTASTRRDRICKSSDLVTGNLCPDQDTGETFTDYYHRIDIILIIIFILLLVILMIQTITILIPILILISVISF